MQTLPILDAVLGSKGRVRVLRALALDRGRAWTGRELASAVDMSPNTVSLALRQLERISVLSIRRYGRAHVVRLRDDVEATDMLASVFEREADLTRRFEIALRRAVPHGVACYVFGSLARGAASPESDVDVLIVARRQDEADEAAARVRRAGSAVLPNRLGIVAMGAGRARRRRSGAVLRSVAREGVLISKTSWEDLV